MGKIIASVVAILVAYCIFIGMHKDSPTAASDYGQRIEIISHRIDTLRMKYVLHDTVELRLKGIAKRIVVHDTIHDTLRAQAIDTLQRALAECDSGKVERDSVITNLDTIVNVVRDSAKATDTHIVGYGVAAIIGALVGGVAAIFLLH